MKREPDLLHVVAAAHASSRFASGLYSRQQQGYQDTDDGNHHQQFDEGKAA
jgi:hypothetical protein